MRGPIPMPMVRRRILTATQVCTLPETAPRAAAFYEPPAEDAQDAPQERDWKGLAIVRAEAAE